MNYEVIITPSAEAELNQAYLWLAERAPEAAVKWYHGLLEVVTTLETFPKRCAFAPERHSFGREIRHLLYGKRQHAYRILFDVRGQTVRVLHIRHGARQTLTPEAEGS